MAEGPKTACCRRHGTSHTGATVRKGVVFGEQTPKAKQTKITPWQKDPKQLGLNERRSATVWEATVWEATVWEATVSQPPISELGVRALSVGGYSVGGYSVGGYSVGGYSEPATDFGAVC